jgi:outer membrane protein TolC
MKKQLTLKLCIILFLLPVAKGFAQESIMNDISYPYLQKLIESAKENYAEIKVKQEQVNIANTTYKESKFAWFDALSVSYIYNPQNVLNLSNYSSAQSTLNTGAGLNPFFSGFQTGINLNIGTLIKNPFNTKNAKANYNIALLEQEAFNASVETQVTKLYLTYLQQMATLRLRTKTALDVETMLNQTKRQFEKGNETIEDYTKATTAFSEINQSKIDAEVAVLIAKGALEEIVGKKLEEVK